MAGLARLEHARQERVDPVQHAEHVDAEEPVPVLDLEVLHVAEDEDTGVVAQHVHPAELGVRGVGDGLHRSEVGHVGVHRERSRPCSFGLGRDRTRRVIFDVGDHDVHPRARELECDGAADAAAAAGDDGRPPTQIVHGVLAHVLV